MAEFELSYAAENDGQPFAAAVALAEISSRRGAHEQALRYIKKFARGYLAIPLEALERFWRLTFPLPYREWLESYARLHLNRCEHSRWSDSSGIRVRPQSRFARQRVWLDAGPAVHRSRVEPRAGMPSFTRDAVRAGDQFKTRHAPPEIFARTARRVETTLAAYNAGKSRVNRWLTLAEYREPAEFVENIPFTETREYVQAVLAKRGHLSPPLRTCKPLTPGFDSVPSARVSSPSPSFVK